MIEVERTNERGIFLIQNQNLSYYVVIPMARQVKILLNLMEKADNEKVKALPLVNDKVVVVPVFTEQIANYLVTPQPSYEQAMSYFSNLINNVYGLLMHNQKQVEQVVLLNYNPAFINFINYFVNKVPGRIQKSDIDLLKKDVPNTLSNSGISTDIPLAYPSDVANQDTSTGENTNNVTKKGEPGFVSYVLLGVVIAVMSLVFLYMLI